jgi:predicted regulator of Ras-like GTPase activity (Roadblock/LC7/MglB family)
VEERLRLLHTNTPEIAASIIVSNDGITIASALPASVKETRVSAMTAAMLSLGERIADELDRGMLDQIYIKGKIGHVVLMSIGGKAVLTTIARENAKIGLLFLDLQRAALDLEKLI